MEKDMLNQINDTIDAKLDHVVDFTTTIIENLIEIRVLTGEVSYLKFLRAKYLHKKNDEDIEKT